MATETAAFRRSGVPLLAVWTLCGALAAAAGEADVVEARAERTGPGTWRFDVTVRHADKGWNHYADKWEVVGPDGTVLGVRELAHPHVEEQPFTRSPTGVSIPDDIREVTVRAGDSVHGTGGAEVTVELK